MSSAKSKHIIVSVVLLVYALLHFDLFLWNQIHPIMFGFMPIGLFYHVIYILLFYVILRIIYRIIWPD